MDKDTLIKVTNRDSGRVGYRVPELGVERQFAPRETKEISFGELEKLSYLAGGLVLLKDYLLVRNEEALSALGITVEPEYFYSEEDVKRILTTGTLNEFLDCLDFAPEGVLELIKDLSVSLPLNDMAKRDAILEKLNFNVTNAITIQNTKYDGGDEAETQSAAPKRRVATPTTTAETGRRTAAPAVPKYKVVEKSTN
jgi:hypothetical protein